MKHDLFVYHLQVNGIFGRNRKPKFDQFVIIETPATEAIDETELRRLADIKMIEIKVKSGRLKITRTPVSIETIDGIEFRTYTYSLAGNQVIDLGTK